MIPNTNYGLGNPSPGDTRSPPGVAGMNFVKPFSGVQKKVTRGMVLSLE